MRNLLLLILLLPVVVDAGESGLPFGLRSVLELRQIPEENLSILVRDIESGETVLELNSGVPRNPASTIKLVTTLAALDVLGPAYQWNTDIYAIGDISEGRLDGDLLIKGHGDPFLVTDRVWQMLRRLRQLGIHDIEGDLIIDDSWFDVPDSDPGAFDGEPLRAYNVSPNALLMNFKVVRYLFEPNFDANAVHVQVDPPLDNLAINNQLRLAKGSCRGYQRGISITPNEAIDKMTFDGRFPSGCRRYAMDRTALDHAAFAFGLFVSLWRESGGRFDGLWQHGTAPDDEEPILSFESLPLADQISRVNKFSNNVMARQLVYTLDAEINGAPGTEEGGVDVIVDWLASRGLDSEHFRMENGSGLSRESRITARQFTDILDHAWRQTYMPEFLSSMSLSGLDGTGRRRFNDRLLQGMAHLKTGSLDHVSAIAGYMQSRSGRRFSVVMMQNHEDIHRGPGDEGHIALLKWLYEQ
ncbi:MAG: D-alanyl-D-alanine carboxypeptidase/D-alanyl-D-alanine-endopeptidase [Pseudomonadota bacterium]